MLSFDRQQEILALLEKHHSMTVRHLAETVHTSEATMRRDLVFLEKQGFVTRVFGGVVLTKYSSMHIPLSARQQENRLAKAEVAARAVQYIHDGSIVLLNGSSTCQLMLPHLRRFQKLTIVSHSLPICKAAVEMNHSVYCIGGALNLQDYTNTGYYAEGMISQLHVDVMFFSCSGVSEDGEMTGVYEAGVSYLHTAMRRADMRCPLCDSTKIGKTFPYRLGSVEDVDHIICDTELPQELQRLIGANRHK